MKRDREEKQGLPAGGGRCPRAFFPHLQHPLPTNVGMHMGHCSHFSKVLSGEIPPPPEISHLAFCHPPIPPELLAEHRKASVPLQLPYYSQPLPSMSSQIPIPVMSANDMKINRISMDEMKSSEILMSDSSNKKAEEKRIWPAMGFGIMDIREKRDSFVIALDLPGISKSDIDISLEQSSIIVECIRKEEELENGVKNYSERHFGKLIRTIQIPSKADPNTIACKYENGVLLIQLNKVPNSDKVKKIRVD